MKLCLRFISYTSTVATLLQVHYEYSMAVGRMAMTINTYRLRYSLKLEDLFSLP